jgi:serine/threonine-protein kinase RsbW
MDVLKVPATMEALEAIADFMSQVVVTAGLDEGTSYRIQLAVDEIATNVIAHGYAMGKIAGVLELRAVMDEDRLTILIEDTGRTYDPHKYRRPKDLDLPFEQRKVGGLGVYLAMHSVDEFHYERLGDRNRHTLVVRR